MLPETFSEQQLRVYCKLDEPRSLEMLKTAFRDWCKNRGFPPPKVKPLVVFLLLFFFLVFFLFFVKIRVHFLHTGRQSTNDVV